MATRFITIDHDTPMLLPADLRAWVPENHLVHFIMEAVGMLDLRSAQVNHSGSGSEQYPPGMMLGLLIFCYATGTFSSRRIERLTYENVAVRLLTADTHPDHDSICAFRVKNKALLKSSFHQVLEAAARIKVLRVGDVTLAIDGTKILANASKHSAVSHDHAIKQMVLLEEQVAQLLAKADAADSTPLPDAEFQRLLGEDLADLRVSLAPSLRLVRSPWPLHAIWAANTEGGPAPKAEAQDVVVLRAAFDPRPHLLPAGGAVFLAGLQAGKTFGESIEDAGEALDLAGVLGLLIPGKVILGVF